MVGFSSRVNQFNRELQKAILTYAVEKPAFEAMAEAVRIAPVLSANLKNKIRVERAGRGKWVYYVISDVPYAYRIEFEGWSHTKAPNGYMRIAAGVIANRYPVR